MIKQLATKESETEITLYLGAVKKGLVSIKWRNINGIIVPGKPGSSKTNTAVFLANQLVANGVKLVRLDYEADETNPQTFINQTSHLTYADFMPYQVEYDEIEKTIAALYELGLKRRKQGTLENANQFPIAVMIDEITSLLALPSTRIEVTHKEELDENTTKSTKKREKTMMDNLNDMMRMFRKANIKFIVMGQNWQAVGNASKMATFRNNFNTVLYHKIVARDVELFGVADSEIKKVIQRLNPGQLVYNNVVVYVPHMEKFPIIKNRAILRASEYPYVTYNYIATKPVSVAVDIPEVITPVKMYPRIDGRWTQTRVLAYLLGVDFKSLKEKGKYNAAR